MWCGLTGVSRRSLGRRHLSDGRRRCSVQKLGRRGRQFVGFVHDDNRPATSWLQLVDQNESMSDGGAAVADAVWPVVRPEPLGKHQACVCWYVCVPGLSAQARADSHVQTGFGNAFAPRLQASSSKLQRSAFNVQPMRAGLM